MTSVFQDIQKKTGLSSASPADTLGLRWYRNRNTFTRNASGQLTALNLCDQKVTDPEIKALLAAEDLGALEVLNLSENQLTELTVPATATALRHLNVSENPALRSLSWGGPLPALESLLARQCALRSFRLPQGFEQLQQLDLRKNQLTEVVLEGDSPALQSLHLGENKLKSFHLPAGYGQLRYLYLLDNQIESLDVQARLANLLTLHLRNNKLQELPVHFLSFKNLETLYLHNNPLPGIPKEVIAQGERENSRNGVWDYLSSLQEEEAIPLRQAKMILVGNGEVGKTSIRLKLLNKKAKLPEKPDRTQLDVVSYPVRALSTEITGLDAPIDFQLSIWDFGGQGKYREVQQLFCSRKSLYLFVTAFGDEPEKTQNYVGFEYWLSMVNAYGYDQDEEHHSPVIHVVNKVDEGQVPINQKDRLDIFPNIYPEFISISCKYLTNFEALEAAIRKALRDVSPTVFSDAYPASWMEVKEELEQVKAPYISYPEYESICLGKGLNESEARTWIRILSRIGSVIYFGDHSELKDWVILNPGWVKDAIYKVLDADLVENGILKPSQYKYIWPDSSKEEHTKFVALLRAYMLAYEEADPHGNAHFVIPALLPAKKPTLPPHLQHPDFQLKLVFNPFIPAGTVNKLIVALQQGSAHPRGMEMKQEGQPEVGSYTCIYNGLMWKNNVILQQPENHAYAHLEEVWEDQAVYLNLYGHDVQPLYKAVNALFSELNEDLRNTKYLEKLEMEARGWYKEKWRLLEDLEDLDIDFFTVARPGAGTTPPSELEKARLLIAQGRLEPALDILEIALPEHLRDEATLLKASWAALGSDKRKGVISRSDYELSRNQIAASALELCNLGLDGEE